MRGAFVRPEPRDTPPSISESSRGSKPRTVSVARRSCLVFFIAATVFKARATPMPWIACVRASRHDATASRFAIARAP